MVRKKHKRHNLTETDLYSKWEGMIQRTHNPNATGYRFYGGRGITVCDEWRNDFEAFYKWSITNGYAKGLQLDRADFNGNYCPENCRYITPLENKRNVRKKVNWGIIKSPNNTYRVQVQRDNKIFRLGTYKTIEECRIERDKFVRGERGVKTLRPDKGIYKSKSGRFIVHVVKNKKCYHVGTYQTVEEATVKRDEFYKSLD